MVESKTCGRLSVATKDPFPSSQGGRSPFTVLDFVRMRDPDLSESVYRFGAFELDPRTGELRKHGIRIKLQDQPLRVLMLLLEHSGELVTREQIQAKLWTPGTYVDYDNAINSAVRKLRDALGDTAENPRFIETFARRGYRFLGRIEAPHLAEEPTPPSPQRRNRVLFGLMAALLLAIVILGVWRFSRSHPPDNRLQITPVPLTAASGWESEPSFSPDGTQVAYVWDDRLGRDVARHIFVKLIGGGAPLPLTSSHDQDRSPAWSPDGNSIAFLRVSKSTRAIYVIPALGGTERKIAEGAFPLDFLYSRSISWSPDGRFLAVAESQSKDAPSALALLNVETGGRTRLTTPPDAHTSDINPAFSPNGRQLLFTRCSKACELYLLHLSANYRPLGNPVPLKQSGKEIEGSAWTADGKYIVYALYKGLYDASIMRVRAVPGARSERFTFTEDLPFSPFAIAVALRGNRFAYTALNIDAQIWKLEPGKPPSSFSPSSRFDSSPEYSADGKHVAFASNRSGLLQIWTCDSSGGTPTQVTHFASGFSGTPRWSPDGRFIAFDHTDDERWDIFVIGSDGSRLRKITPEDTPGNIPSWSADGKWIYYHSDRDNRSEIWKISAKGGKPVQVTANGGRVAFESPDGRTLYYTKNEQPGLWALSLESGQEKKLLAAEVDMEFAVTKDGIYYLAADSKSVRFHSFATGNESEIAHLNVNLGQGLTVSPDRKTFLFTAVLRGGSNVMIVNNFH